MKSTNKYFSKIILAVVMFASVQAVQAAEPATKEQVKEIKDLILLIETQVASISRLINLLLQQQR